MGRLLGWKRRRMRHYEIMVSIPSLMGRLLGFFLADMGEVVYRVSIPSLMGRLLGFLMVGLIVLSLIGLNTLADGQAPRM